MTIQYNGMVATGQSGDILTEKMVTATSSDATLSSGYISLPTGTNNKAGLVALPTNIGSGNKFATDRVCIVTLNEFRVGGTPSSNLPILLNTLTQGDTHPLAVIDTSRKLSLLAYDGTVVATTPSAVKQDSDAAYDEIVINWDFVTLSTVWVAIAVNGTWVVQLNTGLTPLQFCGDGGGGALIWAKGPLYCGYWTPAGSNPGATITGRGWVVRGMDGTDRPHITAYPRVLAAVEIVPTANGDTTAWPNGSGTGFAEIDEQPDDGDTTYIADIQSPGTVSHDALYKHGTANPIPVGGTVLYAQEKFVGRLNGTGKTFCTGLIKDSTGTRSQSLVVGSDALSTAYKGMGTIFQTKGDGTTAFARSDWDLSGGLSTEQTGARSTVDGSSDLGARITLLTMLSPVYYTATLPLAGRPIAVAPKGISVQQAVNRASTY